VLVRAARAKRAAHKRLRFLYILGDDFDGWTMGAMREDAKLTAGSPQAPPPIVFERQTTLSP
jgi:hypothetical protein